MTDVGLGILSRTVPQMNVFVIGMPLKIGLAAITEVDELGRSSYGMRHKFSFGLLRSKHYLQP